MVHAANIYWLRVCRACRDFMGHGNVPGYMALPWHTRCYLNIRALEYFLVSVECLRLSLYLTVWMLAAQILIWTKDLDGPAAAAPGLSAAVWVWPWIASARRRRLTALLHHRWPD